MFARIHSDRKEKGQEGKACACCGATPGGGGGDRHNRQKVEADETAQSKHNGHRLRR